MEKDKVLVIDDEQSIIQAIYRSLMFEDENYELISASNGKEGLEKYYKEEPIVVILDLKMPVMDGITFLEHVKIKSTDPCSVIVVTGHGDSEENIRKCFDLGVSAFLRKPFNNYEFKGLVRHSVALARSQKELKEEMAYRALTLKSLTDQREEFISVLMHDLKNPLIPLTNYARKLLEGRIRSEKDRIEKLKIMHESSQKLLEIIENTSNYLRKTPAVSLSKSSYIEFNKILLLVIKSYMSVIEDRKLALTINGKEEKEWDQLESIFIRGNEYQLKSMIENLLSNAIKYAESSIKINMRHSDSEMRFIITDDGPGIEKIYHKKIFEEYFQVPGSKEGSGLGLYSVKKVVDNHKGKIILTSLPKTGTTFEVVLPLKRKCLDV
jgi:signal transduction histidine kinase